MAAPADRTPSDAQDQEKPVRCRRYKHGGARFYTVDEKGVERRPSAWLLLPTRKSW